MRIPINQYARIAVVALLVAAFFAPQARTQDDAPKDSGTLTEALDSLGKAVRSVREAMEEPAKRKLESDRTKEVKEEAESEETADKQKAPKRKSRRDEPRQAPLSVETSDDEAVTSPGAYIARFPIPTVKMPDTPGNKKALLVRIEHATGDQVDGRTVYTLRRAQKRAKEGDIAAVILDIDTPGGQVSSAFDARNALIDMEPIVTTCYVTRAVSAGALLMLACDNIFVAPGSWLGDAQMIMMTTEGVKSSFGDEAVDEKMTIGLRTEFEVTAQRKGHRTDLARAFADRREGIPGLNEEGIILHLTGIQAVEQRLAIAEVSSIDEILDRLGISGAEVEEFELGKRETFAFFAKSWAWLFLSLAAAGIWMELKSPGIGVPGGVAVFCLGVFFWSNYLAMTASWPEILLFATGIVLLALEVFVIPGFGVAGIGGIVCLVLSVFLSMFEMPRMESGVDMNAVFQALQWPLVHLAISLTVFTAGAALMIGYLPQTFFWRRLALQTTPSRQAGYVGVSVKESWIGRNGVARSTLRPGGMIEIDGKRLDAMTEGGFIQKGSPIKVIGIDGAQLVVEAAPEAAKSSLDTLDG